MADMDWNTNWLNTPQGSRADRIRSLASKLFEQMPSDQYEHGEQHCWAMEFAIHRLIPRRYYESLEEEERFLLLVSPWIMNIAWNRAWNNPERPDDDYYVEANEFLNNAAYQADLGISSDEAKIFDFMIEYHRPNKRLEDCPQELHVRHEPIKVRLLTAYLRLADAIHIDDNIRGPSSLFYFLDDPGSPELFHWFKSKLHLSIEPDPDNNTINVYVQSPIPISEALIQRVKEDLELHVDAVSKTLLIYNVTKYLSVNLKSLQGPLLTDVNKSEVDRLLKEFALSFPRNAGVLQELYVSSIKSAFKKNDTNATAITNEIEQVQTIAKESYSFRPYHIAFARMINEVNTILMENVPDENKARALEDWADSTQRAREERLEKVSEWGSTVLNDFDHFLLFGFSNTIIGTMKRTFSGDNAPRNDIHIYVCEAHNKSRFDVIGRLVYVDGMNYANQLRTELPKATVTLIPDITVADVLNLKKDEDRWIALFGADGITPEARCGNTSGNLTLAVIAKHFGIQVCIICDSYKMGNLPTKALSERREQWMKSVPYWRSERVKLQNLRESVIEPEMISKIITEHGAFTTSQFKDKYSY